MMLVFICSWSCVDSCDFPLSSEMPLRGSTHIVEFSQKKTLLQVANKYMYIPDASLQDTTKTLFFDILIKTPLCSLDSHIQEILCSRTHSYN